MSVTIALAGNPNCGKTTMFNSFTGSSQYVGNWPGVTVEKKDGKLKGYKDVTMVDLPGIYSLSPYTLEEVVTRDYLINEKPHVIINIVDASNIERNLYLTTQLIETGIPVVIALNMMDVVEKCGDIIDIKRLSDALKCSIFETSAVKNDGLEELAHKAVELAESKNSNLIPVHKFNSKIEQALDKITSLADIRSDVRYNAIKVFERDEKIIKKLSLKKDARDEVENIIKQCEKDFDDDAEGIITNSRYEFIESVVKKSVDKSKHKLTLSDKIDNMVTNRWLAIPIFFGIMWLMYFVSIQVVGNVTVEWFSVLFEKLGDAVTNGMESVNAAGWLTSLCVDGIISGVGGVLSFVPQLAVLFIFLSLLEDCGYMSRIAFIMDKVFRKFGLSGKSFIPMIVSCGCGVPGIMSTRTIENEKDRRITMMVTTFIPCGAKLPIVALIAGALFTGSSWVAPSVYFLSIIMVVFSGLILKKTKILGGESAPFVMELPPYHVPQPKSVAIHVWDRTKSFIVKAGTVILLASAIIWALQTFSWDFKMVDSEESMLASIGGAVAVLLKPLGFGNWKAATAIITGLVAKENVVSSFNILYGAENRTALFDILKEHYDVVSAYAFMMFNIICAPCIAAVAVLRKEMGSLKWTLFAVGYQTALAYALALIINQFGRIFVLGEAFSMGTVFAIVVFAGMIYLLARPDKNKKTTVGQFLNGKRD